MNKTQFNYDLICLIAQNNVHTNDALYQWIILFFLNKLFIIRGLGLQAEAEECSMGQEDNEVLYKGGRRTG